MLVFYMLDLKRFFCLYDNMLNAHEEYENSNNRSQWLHW